MPRHAEVLVVAPHISEEHSPRWHLRHVFQYALARTSQQGDRSDHHGGAWRASLATWTSNTARPRQPIRLPVLAAPTDIPSERPGPPPIGPLERGDRNLPALRVTSVGRRQNRWGTFGDGMETRTKRAPDLGWGRFGDPPASVSVEWGVSRRSLQPSGHSFSAAAIHRSWR
jgi:hypothetical protein